MKLKNILLVVKDIEKSKQFYRDLFGLSVILDQEGNVILTEGLVLQDEKIWKKFSTKFLSVFYKRHKDSLTILSLHKNKVNCFTLIF